MADFEFSRDNSGNYQATIGSAGRRVTIQLYGGKVYVDICDYFTKDCFAKDSVFLPTKRGITLTKFEWQQLYQHSEQTGYLVAAYMITAKLVSTNSLSI